nr:MBOAT family O-acyltransferase [uncultured Eisenbergiella sp.]
MLFNSFGYALFLPLVFILYWILPAKFRWIVLLMSSYYFYASWGPQYVAVILLTTIISYIAGLLMESHRKGILYPKTVLILCILMCASILFFFKYFNFFTENLAVLFSKLSIPMQPFTLKLALPIGISFYIFQTISYLVDVYRGTIHAERDFGIYAVYISFFPKVMQGPIERGKKLLPQLHAKYRFQSVQASYGLKLMAWGYFKKLVLADGLSVYVNQVYNNLPAFKGFPLVLATFFFAIQLYCDFSGYTDIALGSARLFGIQLTQNFKSPYFASSIKDFWGRWHISLSSWLKDYVYIPLGGNRTGRIRHALNIMITFLVSGLWHGASWNYILWGGIHGAYQVIEGLFPWNAKTSLFQRNRHFHFLLSILTVPCTFLLVCFAWIFFRAATIQDAIYVLQNMFTGITHFSVYMKDCALQMGLTLTHLLYNCLPVILLFLYDCASLKTDVIAFVSRQRFFIRWPVYIFLLLVILLFSEKGVSTEFIYMQF